MRIENYEAFTLSRFMIYFYLVGLIVFVAEFLEESENGVVASISIVVLYGSSEFAKSDVSRTICINVGELDVFERCWEAHDFSPENGSLV